MWRYVCPVHAKNTLTRGLARLPHARLSAHGSAGQKNCAVGLREPPGALTNSTPADSSPTTHSHTHTHPFIDRVFLPHPLFHTHPTVLCTLGLTLTLAHTKSHTLNTCSHVCTTSHTPGPSLSSHPHTLVLTHPPYHPFHTCLVIHAHQRTFSLPAHMNHHTKNISNGQHYLTHLITSAACPSHTLHTPHPSHTTTHTLPSSHTLMWPSWPTPVPSTG